MRWTSGWQYSMSHTSYEDKHCSVLCNFSWTIDCLLIFLLVIRLSVFLRFTASGFSLDIFNFLSGNILFVWHHKYSFASKTVIFIKYCTVNGPSWLYGRFNSNILYICLKIPNICKQLLLTFMERCQFETRT